MYRLRFNYTTKGTTAIRVRWSKDNTNGGYTSADGALVNAHPYAADQVATHIPAYFNSGMVNMGSYTLTTLITLDGSQPADGLIGTIAIRGGGGGNAFSINSITVERVDANTGSGTLLVRWPDRRHPAAEPRFRHLLRASAASRAGLVHADPSHRAGTDRGLVAGRRARRPRGERATGDRGRGGRARGARTSPAHRRPARPHPADARPRLSRQAHLARTPAPHRSPRSPYTGGVDHCGGRTRASPSRREDSWPDDGGCPRWTAITGRPPRAGGH